jgi:ATP-binding protein involved in chromosome partitioning
MNIFKKEKETEPKDQTASRNPTRHPELRVVNNLQPKKTVGLQAGVGRQPQNLLIPGVKYKVAVASGKGGVGKSTVATNLAIALAKEGAKVGLMDADAYGPSIPTMMGATEKPQTSPQKKLIPIVKHEIKLMSIGFLVPAEQAMIWRGPMLHSAIRQFLGDVDWGELDYLIIDLPPGTGDVQLSLTQSIPLTGGVLVTTPQNVALADVRRSAAMFERLNVPILGVIENMSYFICPHGEKVEIFRSGGGKLISEKLGVPLLGQIPIDPEICDAGDLGVPIVAAHSDSPQSEAFRQVARRLAEEIQKQGEDEGLKIL